MVDRRSNTFIFLLGLVIGILLSFFLSKPQIKEVKVPFAVEVKVPSEEREFEPVNEPKEVIKVVTVKDEKLINQYKAANDSLKEALFNSSVTVRDYKEVFEDSTITITVGAKVTGTLNSLIAEYKTKPKVVVIDTTLSLSTPDYNRSFNVYGELGLQGTYGSASFSVLKFGFDTSNKKNWIWGASYDTEKRVWIKVGKRFNF